jgi:octaprenyl-diphosphate synthase
MTALPHHKSTSSTGILPERIVRKASRTDFYFRPDPWVHELVGQVEEVLGRAVDTGDSLMSSIGRHMVFGHAKRLRPIFILLSQHFFRDETLDAAVNTAAASEFIHCASLFHDDVIDNAETRKGRRAANAIWGNRTAVIMGDHFLVLAYTLLTKHQDFRLIEEFVELCRSLAEGVMMEIRNTGNPDITESEYFKTITSKTAIFFSTAARVGGYIGGASLDEEKHLSDFGLNFGLAFQLSDDLLDLFAAPDATGKPHGSDLRSGIYTASIIRALSVDPDFADKFRPVFERGNPTTDEINEIARMLKLNGTMDCVRDLILRHGHIAEQHLDQLPSGRVNDTFRDLLNRITTREF